MSRSTALSRPSSLALKLPVGRCEDGTLWSVRLHGTHLLIAGATGVGKGSIIWGLVRALMSPMQARLVRMLAADPKLMELAYGRAIFDTYGRYESNPLTIAAMLEQAVQEMPSTLWRVLQETRQRTFTQAQLASPLARRPYDFRHAGVSWRLNAGAPAPLVAEWARHTVEVLLRIYAHCIDGDDERWFGPMEDALGRG